MTQLAQHPATASLLTHRADHLTKCTCLSQQDEPTDCMKKRKSNDGSTNASKERKGKVRSPEAAPEGFGLGRCHFGA